MATAQILSQIGDEETLPILLELADSWSDAETDNPFLGAIDKIIDRLSQNQAGPSGLSASSELVGSDTSVPALPAIPQLDKENDAEGVLGLKIVDKHTGQPLVGSSVFIIFEQNDETPPIRTNKFGRVAVDLSDREPNDLTIEVRQDDYVSTQLRFQPKLTGIPIPKNYLLRLEKGIKVGGVVRTEDGQPVADIDAGLGVLYYGRWDGPERQYVDQTCRTDAKGRWSCNCVPVSASDVYLDIKHAEYVVHSGSRAPIEALLAGSHVLTVSKGLTVTGYVCDLAGTRIPDARIFLGNHPHGEPRAYTDAKGLFKIDKLRAERQLMSVVAAGYAQDMQVVQVEKDTEPVAFALESGYTVTAQIVDVNGLPIEGAVVTAEQWHQVPRHDRTSNIRLSGTSDVQGLVVLKDAPADEVLYSVSKTGCAKVSRFAMLPADEPYQIVLAPVGRLTGQVLDGTTDQPVDEFTLRQAVELSSGKGLTWQGPERLVKTGQYSVNLHHERMAVRIKADGYLPAETAVFVNDGTTQVRDIYLSKASGLYGLVCLPEGSPAKGADVVVATEDKRINVSGMTYERGGQIHATTDASGLFSLPPIGEVFRLLVLHPNGMAEVDGQVFEAGADIVLQPWGRIEAHVDLGPDTERLPEIALHMPIDHSGGPIINHCRESLVDRQGNVVFENVRPGYVRVSKGLRHPDGSMNWANPQYVEVLPGETVFIDSIANGREVKAQLVQTDGEPIDLGHTEVHLKTDMDLSVLELPDAGIPEELFCTAEESWQSRLLQGELGRVVRARASLWPRLERVYNGHVDPDGAIQILDVVPGRYNLTALFKDARTDRRFGAVLSGIDIPDVTAEGGVPHALDLGNLEMTPRERVAIGDPAPDFELDDLAGNPVRLIDYKGKFLLMEIGGPASQSNYVRDTLPYLRDVYETFGGAGQLNILSVCGGWSIAALDLKPQFEYFVRANNIPWKVAKTKAANLGELTDVLGQYTHKFVLVDPDGTVVAGVDAGQAAQLPDIVRRAIKAGTP